MKMFASLTDTPLAPLAAPLQEAGVVAVHVTSREARVVRNVQQAAIAPLFDDDGVAAVAQWVGEHGSEGPDGHLVFSPEPGLVVSCRHAISVGWRCVARVLPTPLPDPDDLARRGVIAPLAARLLRAAGECGRNLLLVGEREPCWQIALALCGGAAAVAARLAPDMPMPPGWFDVATPQDGWIGNGERTVHMTGDTQDLVRFLLASRGCVGWMPAQRLEQALMRFEIAAHPLEGPLAVPAGIDLTVVVARTAQQQIKVIAVNEIVLAAPVYRPMPLFQLGGGAFAEALTPCAVPTFGGELRTRGHDVLMDELVRAVPESPAAPRQAPPSQPPPAEPPVDASPIPSLPSMVSLPPDPGPDMVIEPVAEAPEHEPGWELELIMAQGGVPSEDDGAGPNAEAQEMAASFGLGPPPRPAGVRTPELVTKPQSLYSYPTGQHDSTLDVLDRGPQGEPPSSEDGDDDKEQASFSEVLAQRRARED